MTANKFNYNPEQFFNAETFKPFMNAKPFDTEAFAALQKETTEAAKTLTQCQTNFARESMEDVATFWRNWMSSGPNLQDKVELQTQATREGFAKAMAHNKEVTAIVQKTQEKVMRTISEQTADVVKKDTKSKK